MDLTIESDAVRARTTLSILRDAVPIFLLKVRVQSKYAGSQEFSIASGDAEKE